MGSNSSGGLLRKEEKKRDPSLQSTQREDHVRVQQEDGHLQARRIRYQKPSMLVPQSLTSSTQNSEKINVV